MSKLISNERELQQILEHNKNILVLFYASWCYYSQRFLPIFEAYTATGDYCRVLTDEVPGCDDKYSIETVPAVLFFQDGKVARRLDSEPGAGLSEDQLKEMVAACGMAGGTETSTAGG